jgi:putative Ca2+/H+ antiporter (TMEM165/GDT1 family)
MRAYVMVFVSVLLAEMGDKTQLATLLFATDTSLSRSGVVLAAAAALVTSTLVAVSVGTLAGAWVRPRVLNTVAGLGFIVIGLWALVRA